MTSRRTAICLSSDGDSESLTVTTGSEPELRPIVSDAQVAQLVISWSRTDCTLVPTAQIGPRVTSASRSTIRTLYGKRGDGILYRPLYCNALFPEAQFVQVLLKECMREASRSKKFRAKNIPVDSVITTTRATPMPAVAAAVLQNALLRTGKASLQAPAEQQAQRICTASNLQAAIDESNESPSLEQQQRGIRRRVHEHSMKLKDFKQQKLIIENLKFALELEVISRAECAEQGRLLVEMWMEERSFG